MSTRPDAIDRAFIDAGSAGELGDIVRPLLKSRRTFREVGVDDLDRLAQTRHHEGVVLFAPAPVWPSWEDLLDQPGPAQLAIVDEGLNPHNLGAVMRSAGYFGVRALGAVRGLGSVSGAAARIAEGAAERVPYARLDDGPWSCRMAKARDFVVVATDVREGATLFGLEVPGPRVLWLLGHEGRGLSPDLRAEADQVVSIPGSGVVESLNVSVAAGLAFAEGWRMRAATRGEVIAST